MTRIGFRQHAGEHERYAKHAFGGVIGKTVPWTFKPTEDEPGNPLGWATVVSVTVDDDGRGATWVVDVEPDPRAPERGENAVEALRVDGRYTPGGMPASFSLRPEPVISERWWDT